MGRPGTPLESSESKSSRVEERPLFRGWLHFAGLVVSLLAGPLLVLQAKNGIQVAGLTIYAVSLVVLFGTSSSFHRIRWQPGPRRIMKRLDHSAIFILIAGTYTAVAAVALHGWAALTILLVAWVGAIAGITVRQLLMNASKAVAAIPYVIVGWCALLVVPQLVRGLGGWGFALLLLGGLAYTAGAIVYGLKKPDLIPGVFGYHEVFHSLTLVGAALHYIVIIGFALPRAT
jgi:hemolysin III